MRLWVISSLLMLVVSAEVSTNETKADANRCERDYLYYNDKCYYFSCKDCKKSYYDAQKFCAEMGGNLVTIQDENENTFLSAHSDNFFTGLRFEEDEKKLKWSSDEPLSFEKLPEKFEDKCGYFGRCVKIKNNEWRNAVCHRKYRWVCEKKPIVLKTVCPEKESEPFFDGGEIYNPNYPQEYSGSSTCYFNLIVKTDELITIVFNETRLYYDPDSPTFDHDEIEIYEGFEDDPVLIGRIDGASEPGATFQTQSFNEMTVRFHAGSKSVGKWRATWYARPNKHQRYVEAYRKYLMRNEQNSTTSNPSTEATTILSTITGSTNPPPDFASSTNPPSEDQTGVANETQEASSERF